MDAPRLFCELEGCTEIAVTLLALVGVKVCRKCNDRIIKRLAGEVEEMLAEITPDRPDKTPL